MATQSKQSTALTSPGYLVPFIIVTALFFIFGFITNLNMGMVPDLKKIFEIQGLATWQAMLANGAFFTAYFVFSSPTGKLIELIGYKRTMVVSLFVQVLGALLFVPAAQQVSFPLFLLAIFVVGAGVAALQTAANPYVSILGPEHSAPIRLNLAQALNSLGGTFAPWVAGTFILTTTVLNPSVVASQSSAEQHAYQLTIADTVRVPYLVIAFALIILGIAVAFTRLPHVEATQQFRPAKEGDPLLSRSIWSYRHTVLGALGIFVYVGVEVGLATTMVLYFSDTIHGGLHALTVAQAQKLVVFYWLGALVGRLLGSWMLTKIAAGKLLGIFGTIAAVLVVHRMPGPCRLLQLHHVPEYLYTWYCKARTNDQQRFGAHHDCGVGRRADSGLHWLAGRQHQLSMGTRCPGSLLPLHRLLRLCRAQTLPHRHRVTQL
jgi:FHS family L-fucose permease-like MFS transporter